MKFNASLSAVDWEVELDRVLPIFGHRNWIVIADSAYPAQSNAGIDTIATGAPHLDVLEKVLRDISNFGHVRANVYVDRELKSLTDDDAHGVSQYREELNRLLNGSRVHELAHEEIIANLDRAGTLFRILILKTTLRIPYTSVFLELDCGYWDAPAESRLRALLADSEIDVG